MTFLKIFNNVRVNKELLKVVNYADSNLVGVLCEEDSLVSTIQYLEQYGKIHETYKVKCFSMADYVDYDLDEFDDYALVEYTY